MFPERGIICISIDVATERKLMSVVKRRLDGKTVVSFLHHLTAAARFDRVLILGDREGSGTPNEVARRSQYYNFKLGRRKSSSSYHQLFR